MRRSPEQTRPEYRHLRIFAIDPMVARGGEHRATVQLRFEELERRDASFFGRRIEVADVDTSGRDAVWLEPVDLDSAHIAMQHGLEPSESDPQFHQQMVYAVAMRTLEQFDRALGRMIISRVGAGSDSCRRCIRGANAFYHPKLRAVLFGYFSASDESPGENLPGQTIFTCLSHDIVAHEVTHAIVDRLRPHFNIATNPHVRAFHEAFADIVAVFQRLTFRDLVRQALQEARGKLANSSLLTDVAAQFGQGLGSGAALRTALSSRRAFRTRRKSMTSVRCSSRLYSMGFERRSIVVPPIFSESRPAERAFFPMARSIPISSPASPPNAFGRRKVCSRCAFARSTICRRRMSTSAPSSAPS